MGIFLEDSQDVNSRTIFTQNGVPTLQEWLWIDLNTDSERNLYQTSSSDLKLFDFFL